MKSVAINLQDQAVLLEAGEGFKTSEIAPHITNGEYNYDLGVRIQVLFPKIKITSHVMLRSASILRNDNDWPLIYHFPSSFI